MSGSAAKVVISERQQSVLQQLSTARTVAQYLVVRASIILLAFQGLNNQAIAARVGLGRHQIGIWRCRWQANLRPHSEAISCSSASCLGLATSWPLLAV